MVQLMPKSDDILITGDFNIDVLDVVGHDVDRYLSVMDSSRNTATLINHILVSDEALIANFGVTPLRDISDHCFFAS